MELSIQNLSKSYGAKKALVDLNCTFHSGVYGLLGANGAGKSTLMNIITGGIQADSGSVLWNGHNILEGEGRDEFRSKLGYMPQYPVVYKGFCVSEFLYYISALRGMDKKGAKEQIERLLGLLELAEVRNKKVTELSGGMKQRMMLAQAMLGDPQVLILDEPTAGLDPKQRIAVRNLISEVAFHKIVIIATHVVTDVEFISQDILLLKEGCLIQKAQREDLIDLLDGRVYEIRVKSEELPRIQSSYLVGNIVKNREYIFVRVISEAVPREVYVEEVRPSLEDVYLYYFRE